jgi:ankyrin repeat protein
MLDLFMANLHELGTQLRVVVDSVVGSVLHYFAAIDYAKGIQQLASEPHNHPPDLRNDEGDTPLQVAIKSHSFAAVLQLLALGVDIEYPGWSALQIITQEWLNTDDEDIKVNHAVVMDKLFKKGKVYYQINRTTFKGNLTQDFQHLVGFLSSNNFPSGP